MALPKNHGPNKKAGESQKTKPGPAKMLHPVSQANLSDHPGANQHSCPTESESTEKGGGGHPSHKSKPPGCAHFVAICSTTKIRVS